MFRIMRLVMLAAVTSALGAGCRTGDSAAPAVLARNDVPVFPSDPSGFVAQIDNPYLAFAPRRVFHYQSVTADGLETSVVEVTNRNKRILGIAATVVHDQVYLDGALVEDTFDWYAQDQQGNVWYLGEDSKQIENGVVVGTEGSWEAGVNGATAGIIMLAQPKVGTQYRQEFAAGVAEDMAKVLDLSTTVQVNFGSFTGCLKTEEWTPLEPGVRESKYYKPGVGLVLELQPKGGGVRNELTAIEN
jgi:hypothetical protein